MGWDADEAERYAEVSASLSRLASRESDGPVKDLLLSMSADCETLAGYFRASEEAAALRCAAGAGVAESEERLQANRETNALMMKLQKQWELLAAALGKGRG